ncbi:hypothetical protein B0A48_09373 [Cryoendolithus antarcticus]|uniref:Uncharacterized protein n=1 Tax=Cryoendolithus antarcticus TaxID=1507870 RepID=A0A1V8SZL1_9PEZI|nr:hypothetical protein B0A48_09373 [Cryoendolithus antarcticus]
MAEQTANKPNAMTAEIRQRLATRKASQQDLRSPPALSRRRSSLISYSSLDDMSSSFDDLVNPTSRHRRPVTASGEEFTHWHSTPLAFAILPALAGLLFNNGSAFVTDVLLLGLAAVFMNWSIRIPRDWYHSAQAVGESQEGDLAPIDEESEADIAVDSESDSSPKQEESATVKTTRHRDQAKSDLERQEVHALLASFVMPAVAAYLLHVIRAQLSRPSTGLVSDYNLSVFLLAAEFWPTRQVLRLITARTLHLQRTATGLDDPYNARKSGVPPVELSSLTTRLAELEARLTESNPAMAQKTDIDSLSVQLQKRYEPRLEGLERAVRRYEKRSATLAMVTEQRLQSLEVRLQDALSLAAVAAQHSQGNVVTSTVSILVDFALMPAKIVWSFCVWPLHVGEQLYVQAKALVLGPSPVRAPRRRTDKASVGNGIEERVRDKAALRKPQR